MTQITFISIVHIDCSASSISSFASELHPARRLVVQILILNHVHFDSAQRAGENVGRVIPSDRARTVKTDVEGNAELSFVPQRGGYYRVAWSSEDDGHGVIAAETTLLEFKVHSVTPGMDALGTVTVRVGGVKV